MPMRVYHASTAYAGAHIKANLWLCTMALSAAMLATVALRQGTIAAFLGMAVGILVMMKGEEGYVRPEAEAIDGPVLPVPGTPPLTVP